MFTEFFLLDWLGWAGMLGLGLFYWLIGSGKVLQAYVWGTLGAGAWLIVGVLTYYGYAAQLPSLILMETMVIILNIRGIINWRKQKDKEILHD